MTLMEQHCSFFETEYCVFRWNILAVDFLMKKIWKEKKIKVISIVVLYMLCSVQY